MSNSIKQEIRRVAEAKGNFSHLVSLTSLSPDSDFAFSDFSNFDFEDSDLTAFRFRGAHLDGADLSRTKLTKETIYGALLINAKLPRQFEKLAMAWANVQLKPHQKDALIASFGSLKVAGHAAALGAFLCKASDIQERIEVVLERDQGFQGDEEGNRRSTVTMTAETNSYLTAVSDAIGYGKGFTLNFLLLEILEVLESRIDLKDEEAHPLPPLITAIRFYLG